MGSSPHGMRMRLAGLILTVSVVFSLSSCRARTEPAKTPLLGNRVADLARHLCGIPYRAGGDDVDGFDCSGLVSYVYGCYGVRLPREARAQAKLKRKVPFDGAKPGDILIFRIKRTWHSAVFVGDNRFVHAPKGNALVRQEDLSPFWLDRLRSVIRISGAD